MAGNEASKMVDIFLGEAKKEDQLREQWEKARITDFSKINEFLFKIALESGDEYVGRIGANKPQENVLVRMYIPLSKIKENYFGGEKMKENEKIGPLKRINASQLSEAFIQNCDQYPVKGTANLKGDNMTEYFASIIYQGSLKAKDPMEGIIEFTDRIQIDFPSMSFLPEPVTPRVEA
jgi:hypothetical protein